MSRLAIALVLLMTAVSACRAEGGGKWQWNAGDSGYFARTESESGERLGQLCQIAERKCSWLLGLKRSCSARTTYPLLASTDLGGAVFQITCIGPSAADSSLYEYSIGEFDNIDDLLGRARKVGFALPLQPNRFYTVEFDLSGAKQTVDAMRKAATAEMQKPR